jgi:hypothetical protein
MNKEALINEKLEMIRRLEKEISSIEKIELNRLYRINENYREAGPKDSEILISETVGYFECFNRESVRFCVAASDNPIYCDKRWKHRGNITSFGYAGLDDRLTRVKKDDLPLLIGLKFKSVEFEKILKKRKRVKVDG